MAKDNYHDKGYKELLSKKRNFMNFLRHFVDSKWVSQIDEETLHLCDKGFVDSFFKELESDLIYSAKAADKDVYFYVLTELQSTVDYTMPFRLFKYVAAILMRVFEDTPQEKRERSDFRLPAVVPILFYNGDERWVLSQNFKDYLQGADLFDSAIDFRYDLVDIKLLEREHLLKNHDAICAAIAVDKVRGDGFEELFETLLEISESKTGFDPEEFKDFLTWLKHTLEHRVGSQEEAEKIVGLIEEGDENIMRTGIDILFDNAEARGVIESAVKLLKKGMTLQEVADLLDLTDEQVKQVALRAGLKTGSA